MNRLDVSETIAKNFSLPIRDVLDRSILCGVRGTSVKI